MSSLLSINQKPSLGLEAKRIRLSLPLTQHELATITGVSLEEVDLFEHTLSVQVDVKLKILRELWTRQAGKDESLSTRLCSKKNLKREP